ncbi:radial spoke head protein 3 homolog B-like [Coccinella septempunctata]|uniref:radial spoke head protein 3 homolog B-like n=1 Tax=Coccinella septempunctata TaxID=41139 RepID=UPI001D0670CE|nr:radial spoke head protein 3 homolog B-like [Coccinella septempunctata]
MKMTEVALPLQTSLFDDGDDNTSFQVINNDNLPMTVLGERIFKPFGSENQKRKPNGIVYPTRRVDLTSQQISQQKHLTKSNGHLNVPQKLSSNNSNFRKLSASHGNLNNLAKNRTQDEFTRNLDAKLKKLQTDRKGHDASNSKKPFITTVKKGQFLSPETSPPPSKTSRIEEDELNRKNAPIRKQLYAFVSRPMVLSRSPPQNVHRSRCEAAAIAAGVSYTKECYEIDTSNEQRQRRKRETRTLSPEKPTNRDGDSGVSQKNDLPKWNPYFAYAKLLSQEESPVKKTREEIAKRRAMARKKARMQSSKKSETITSNATRNIRMVSEGNQTDNYLQAILLKPPNVDSVVQTELDLLDGIISSQQVKREAQDEETQIIPGDLFDFEEEVQPVLEVLVGKTVENALIEILEEEELASLKEQQRRYLEIRAEEERIAGELLEKHFVDRLRRNKTGGTSILLENYLSQLIPPVLEELQSEGILPEDKVSMNGSLLPWLMEEVTIELGDILSSGDVLNGIIRDILNRRKELTSVMDIPEDSEETQDITKITTNNEQQDAI